MVHAYAKQIATLRYDDDDFYNHMYIYVYVDLNRKNLFISYDRDKTEVCPVKGHLIEYCEYKDKDISCLSCPEADRILVLKDTPEEKILIPVKKIFPRW
jgi:hypothetical protein